MQSVKAMVRVETLARVSFMVHSRLSPSWLVRLLYISSVQGPQHDSSGADLEQQVSNLIGSNVPWYDARGKERQTLHTHFHPAGC